MDQSNSKVNIAKGQFKPKGTFPKRTILPQKITMRHDKPNGTNQTQVLTKGKVGNRP